MTPTSVSHRRGRRRRTQAERYILEQVRAAIAMPLVFLAALLCVALVAWQVADLSVAPLVLGLAFGVGAAAILGALRAQAAAAALQRAREAEIAALQQTREAEIAALRHAAAAGLQRITDAANAVEKALLWTADELCRGGRPPVPDSLPPLDGEGPVAELEGLLAEVQVQAVQALLRVHDESQLAVLVGLLHHLSRREHAFIKRALEALDELENLTDDPELLAKAYEIDHLVTRMRRLVESKAVLGGDSLRSERRPVPVVTVLRGAVSEVEHYSRVAVAASTVGAELALPGHVGPDFSHLVAELIENSCTFSDPNTKVHVRAQPVSTGLAIEVEDRAMPMKWQDREKLNQLLAAPEKVDVSTQLREAKIGLLVAAKIAHRHGMSIKLSENATGGTTALVVVPAKHLVPVEAEKVRPARQATTAPAPGRPSPAAPPSPPTASEAEERTQPAPVEAHQAPALASPGHPAAPPPLPQRVPGQLRITNPADRPGPPARAARANLAAAFFDGQKAAQPQEDAAAEPPPQPSGTGEPSASHP
ncbi:sensor histidine kinase [Streptomyces sp. NRRL F-5527]|uniref:sensor histidine kinase n=1 Tax=Streptomyces sp. NRRL F-5527 TaxID=1463862 RepID=UPI00099B328B|nr:ATP-binding protein [Streptomyces sp. NRRL F-5527]